ncbi:MAG TPA: hypothetical protein VK582_25095 [Pyrinomonadaceae bacterium]|nr:hypothetical protein [Pyrinomonadaceae bacterium]
MPPLAALLAPSAFPLGFTEVVAFRGDFGGAEVVNPKGIAYHASLNRLIVSISPSSFGQGQRVQMLNAVAANGARTRFGANYQMYRDVESLVTIVPPAGPPSAAGFTPGDVFVGRGPGDQISRLSTAGNVVADVFVDLGTGGGLWGGLTFDTGGAFGGRLIGMTTGGKLFLVTSSGVSTLLADLGRRLEGVTVAPAGFGPLAGQIIVGVEGGSDTDPESGKVYAVNASGNPTLLADIGFAAEDIQFVPPNGGTFYQAELCFDRERENRIMAVSGTQFLNRLGRMIVVNELSGEYSEVAWDGIRYTQSLIGRVPGRWSSQGFNVQGTELEAACFAARPPTLPGWTPWAVIPGGATTDRPPVACADASGNLHLLIKGVSDSRVYMNNMWGSTQVWTGWMEVPPGGLITKHALAMALHDNVLYAFAVRDDGAILFKRLYIGSGNLLDEPWTEVPGGGHTDTAVSVTTSNGRLVLAAKGIQSRQVYLNELAPGGRSWSGWVAVPGGGQTNVSPAVASFQDELYVLIKDVGSARVLAKVRSANGDWTDSVELPGTVSTDVPPAAVTASGQLSVFAKGATDGAPFWNVSSDTGTWSRWQAMPSGATTDAALAASAIGNRLYLFSKGTADRQIYMRFTN